MFIVSLGPLNLSFSKMAVYMEESCAKGGGMCMDQDECPKGKLLKRGLCPEQQKRGVECCNGCKYNTIQHLNRVYVSNESLSIDIAEKFECCYFLYYL